MPRPVSRPEASPIDIGAGGGGKRRQRDLRIDAFRGIALMMILINHIPGNPYEVLTIRGFGFSDAAEGFFVMSGIAVALAYAGGIERWRAQRGGLWQGIAPILRRVRKLYLVQIFLTLTALALFALAAERFAAPELRALHNGGWLYESPGQALAGLVTLTYQVNYVNILPPYILLMLAAPLLIRCGLAAPRATLAASLGLWFVAGLLRLDLPVRPGTNGWQFNPFAWQAIFVVGLMIGLQLRRGARLVPVTRPLLALSTGFLVLAFAMVHVPSLADPVNRAMYRLETMGVPFHIVSHYKPYLALPRFLHALALIYLLSCLPVVRRLAAHSAAAPFRLLGRQGLLVFGVGTILALCGQIALLVRPEAGWLLWVLPPLAVLLSIAAAWIGDAGRRAAAVEAAAAAGPAPAAPAAVDALAGASLPRSERAVAAGSRAVSPPRSSRRHRTAGRNRATK
ncbi:OpgC family protein [Tropicimonas sp. IMCC34043]|uniref:OpgC family protein n=1 Tax=Tropicimonas sp. IMCC34043 TaxID=2248760 RepID=UPI000E25E3E0|nr:OpgC domain-containing protein [Tropicimonas sp. IMCC34043]